MADVPYPDGGWPWLHVVCPPDGFSDAPPGMNTFLRASLGPFTQAVGDSLYVIASLGGYLVVGVLETDAPITWALGTELEPGSDVQCDPRLFPRDPAFIQVIEKAAALGEASRKAMSERASTDVQRRISVAATVVDPTNPHVVAVLADIANRGRQP